MIEDKIKYNDYWERVQEKDKEIERLHSIIKEADKKIYEYNNTIREVKEYLESNPLVCIYDTYMYVTDIEQLEKHIEKMSFIRTLKEILDKEVN